MFRRNVLVVSVMLVLVITVLACSPVYIPDALRSLAPSSAASGGSGIAASGVLTSPLTSTVGIDSGGVLTSAVTSTLGIDSGGVSPSTLTSTLEIDSGSVSTPTLTSTLEIDSGSVSTSTLTSTLEIDSGSVMTSTITSTLGVDSSGVMTSTAKPGAEGDKGDAQFAAPPPCAEGDKGNGTSVKPAPCSEGDKRHAHSATADSCAEGDKGNAQSAAPARATEEGEDDVQSATPAPATAGDKGGDKSSSAPVNGAAKNWEDFNPDNFDDPTDIDNPWMPLKPGTRFIYEGTTVEDDGTVLPHRVEIVVTDLTKEIGGIRSVVTYDLDYRDDELVEAELAFYAQDNDGNVWRMGEYPVEYEGDEVVATPAWFHGLEDARAGIMMQAKPEVGTPSYSQGWGPAVEWTDRGQVDQMGERICVPEDCYKKTLVIAESSASEPDSQQLKYYARNVGNVYVSWRGNADKTKETLELVDIDRLSSKALKKIRVKALALEELAYEHSSDLYVQMPPAKAKSNSDD